MADEKTNEPRQEPSRKENNPFSEQEKHGDEAQRRNPGTEREYQGGQSDEHRVPGVEDDTEENRRKRAQPSGQAKRAPGSDSRSPRQFLLCSYIPRLQNPRRRS